MSLHSKRTELKMKRNIKLFSHVDIYLLVVLVPVPASIQLHCITIIDIVKSEHTTLLVLQALSHHRIKTESNCFKFDSYDGWLRSIANSRKSEIRIFFFCFVPLSVVSQMEWMTRILLIFYYTAEWVVSMVYKFIWEMTADRVTLSTGGF